MQAAFFNHLAEFARRVPILDVRTLSLGGDFSDQSPVGSQWLTSG